MSFAGRHVGVVGAAGYIGRLLLPALHEEDARVRAIARHHHEAIARLPGIEQRQADALDRDALCRAFDGLDIVYWLVHSMGSGRDFADRDRRAAENAAAAASGAGVGRIIFLGGLGDDQPQLSPHLKSRRETAEILVAGGVPTTTLRAAMIIGSGSASFRMLRDLVTRLPAMITPRWVANRTQPLAAIDLRRYLVGCGIDASTAGEDYDIGGPDVLTYAEMMRRCARAMGRREPLIVPVPVLSPELSSRWAGLVTEVDRHVAKPLVESLRVETVAKETRIRQIVPFELMGFDDAVRRALAAASPAP